MHPADLSILDENKKRVFVGDDAVLDAVKAGQTELRASTLWVDKGVDSGPLLLISRPIAVDLPATLAELLNRKEQLRAVADEHQERLKEIGDWEIFPRTILMMAEGRIALDEQQNVYVDGQKYESGFRI